MRPAVCGSLEGQPRQLGNGAIFPSKSCKVLTRCWQQRCCPLSCIFLIAPYLFMCMALCCRRPLTRNGSRVLLMLCVSMLGCLQTPRTGPLKMWSSFLVITCKSGGRGGRAATRQLEDGGWVLGVSSFEQCNEESAVTVGTVYGRKAEGVLGWSAAACCTGGATMGAVMCYQQFDVREEQHSLL